MVTAMKIFFMKWFIIQFQKKTVSHAEIRLDVTEVPGGGVVVIGTYDVSVTFCYEYQSRTAGGATVPGK